METIEIKVLRDLPGGQKAGKTYKVKSNKGIPLNRYWRDRIKDSVINGDGCVELVKKSNQTKGGSK